MSSLKSTSLSVMRPPKPPCWRDFVAPTARSIASEGVDVVEALGRNVGGARSPIVDFIDVSRSSVSLPGNKPSRLSRRPRAKIHRTRSEHIIHAEELPESAFTGTLADTDPKGLRTRVSEGCLYVEENNRRCQNWLASIEAAEPLDEVVYTNETSKNKSYSGFFENTERRHSSGNVRLSRQSDHDLIPIGELDQDEEVEIPEETFSWDISQENRPQSSSSGEELYSTCSKLNPQADATQPINMSCASHEQLYCGGVHADPKYRIDPSFVGYTDTCERHQKTSSEKDSEISPKHHPSNNCDHAALPDDTDCTSSKSLTGASDTLTLTLGPVGNSKQEDLTTPGSNVPPTKRSNSFRNVSKETVDTPALPHLL